MLGEVQAAAEEAKARLVAEAEAERAAAEAPTGKLFTVFSTKGGVGKSLVAVNTAVALAQQKRRVCLVDLDVNSGDVAIMLQLAPTRNVNDLVGFAGSIDEGAIESLLTPWSDHLSVVAAPVHLDSPDQASADEVGMLLDGLKAIVRVRRRRHLRRVRRPGARGARPLGQHRPGRHARHPRAEGRQARHEHPRPAELRPWFLVVRAQPGRRQGGSDGRGLRVDPRPASRRDPRVEP